MDLYSKRADERRRQFNNIINGIDMVLMNNIPEVDPSVWENWQGDSPNEPEPCDWFLNNSKPKKRWCCNTHQFEGDEDLTEDTEHPEQCDWAEEDFAEVYQWFAVAQNDADFLKQHSQYITYSDMLDTYFLAICHFGTGWDYVDSMVEAFSDCYHDLENFSDKEGV